MYVNHWVRRAAALVAGVVVLSVLGESAGAQSMAERLKQKAKERLEAKGDQAIDKGLDKLEGTVNCLVGDAACIDKAKKAGKPVKTHKSQDDLDEANRVAAEAAEAAEAAKLEKAAAKAESKSEPQADAPPPVDTKMWENFDFVPGERVLFADDFSRDRIGNFPQRLQLIEGNAQVVEALGTRWLQASSGPTMVQFNLPESLPQRFTVEFDMTISQYFPTKIGIKSEGEADPDLEAAQTRAFVGAGMAGLAGGGVRAQTPITIDGKSREALVGTKVRVRLHADGDYMKMYVNERRVANVPSAKFGRAKQLVLMMWGSDEAPVLAGNFTIAAGGRSLYDALLENGRVATQGILFDTGSDRIKPESAPTLKQIGDMLKDHADLKLMIEGHTDNVGSAPSNLSLSDRRAAAVKAYLGTTFGIDGARLQTKGFGDTKPAAPNTTNEGKQQNRRVELVKLP